MRPLDYLGSHAFFATLLPERLDINVVSEMEALASALHDLAELLSAYGTTCPQYVFGSVHMLTRPTRACHIES